MKPMEQRDWKEYTRNLGWIMTQTGKSFEEMWWKTIIASARRQERVVGLFNANITYGKRDSVKQPEVYIDINEKADTGNPEKSPRIVWEEPIVRCLMRNKYAKTCDLICIYLSMSIAKRANKKRRHIRLDRSYHANTLIIDKQQQRVYYWDSSLSPDSDAWDTTPTAVNFTKEIVDMCNHIAERLNFPPDSVDIMHRSISAKNTLVAGTVGNRVKYFEGSREGQCASWALMHIQLAVMETPAVAKSYIANSWTNQVTKYMSLLDFLVFDKAKDAEIALEEFRQVIAMSTPLKPEFKIPKINLKPSRLITYIPRPLFLDDNADLVSLRASRQEIVRRDSVETPYVQVGFDIETMERIAPTLITPTNHRHRQSQEIQPPQQDPNGKKKTSRTAAQLDTKLKNTQPKNPDKRERKPPQRYGS